MLSVVISLLNDIESGRSPNCPLFSPKRHDVVYVGFAVEKETFSPAKSFFKLTMELTKSFPPADAFVEMMLEIDYKKHFNTFMDGVENLCVIVAAIATVIAQKWQEYDCTERLQLFVLRVIEGAKTFYAWVKNVFVPECKSLYDDCRSVYNFVRTV